MASNDMTMRHAIAAFMLALPACAASSGGDTMSAIDPQCIFVGQELSGGDPSAICRLFLDATSTAGLNEVARIELAASSQNSARAVAYDADGNALGELDFDVMDANLDIAQWQIFARHFALHLKPVE